MKKNRALYFGKLRFLFATVAGLLLFQAGTAPASTFDLRYSFDADEGGTVTDLSGNGHTGTVNGAAWTAAGWNGGAYAFDGTNDTVSCGYLGDINDYSTSLWFKRRTAGSYGFMLGTYRSSPNKIWAMGIDDQNKYNFYIHTDDSDYIYTAVSLTGLCDDTNWHHVVATRKGTNLKLYLDGVDRTIVTASNGLPAGAIQSGTQTYIGQHGGGISGYFDGSLDEARIYGRELSAAEVVVLYTGACVTVTEIENTGGATGVGSNTATLNGKLFSTSAAPTTVHIFWGPSDGMANIAAWSNAVDLGARGIGSFATEVSGLATDAVYYYRSAASNADGLAWAADSISFTTLGAATLLTNGLSLYYSFTANETVVPDDSGNGHTGTVNGATWAEGGWKGGTYVFDGTNDCISCGNLGDINDYSASLRFKRRTPSSYGYMLGTYRTSPNKMWVMGIDDQNTYSFWIYTDDADYIYTAVSLTDLCNDTNWHHVVATRKGTKIKLYLDGVDRTSVTSSNGVPTNAIQSGSQTYIGQNGSGLSFFFDGRLDDVRIYTRELSTNEITVLYNNAKFAQSIDFPAPGNQIVTNTLPLIATASSQLPASFEVAAGPASLSGDSNLSFSATGLVTVVASQNGGELWYPAPLVTNTFEVNKATASVTLTNLSQTYDGTSREAAAITVPGGLTVDMTYDGSATAPIAAGFYVITGAVNDALYEGSATGVLVVAKANQTLTFANPGAQLATNVVKLAPSASSGLPVILAVGSGPADIDSNSNLTFSATGQVTITASQSGDSNWNPAASVTNTFDVGKAAAGVVLTGLNRTYNGSPRTVTATTTPAGLTVSITYDGTAAAPTDVGSYAVTGMVNELLYDGAATGTLVISKGSQTIAFTDPGPQLRAAQVPLIARASSGLPVRFAVLSGPGLIAASSNLSFTGIGTVRVAARQSGNANWNAAPQVVRTIGVFNLSPNDYDGDGISDLAAFTAGGGAWEIRYSDGGGTNLAWGFLNSTPVCGDYDGDGKADIAVFYNVTGRWYIRTIGGSTLAYNFAWGWPSAATVAGDYDGDGKDDLAVYDENTGKWYIWSLAKGSTIAWNLPWGWAGAKAVAGDYDGDGVSDLAVLDVNIGHWYIYSLATKGSLAWNVAWGWAGCAYVPGDYDGDGRSDLAVYDQNTQLWYIYSLTTRKAIAWKLNWGFSGGIPVSGDYDGDGRTDFSMYNPANGKWYIRDLNGQTLMWGQTLGGGAAVPVRP